MFVHKLSQLVQEHFILLTFIASFFEQHHDVPNLSLFSKIALLFFVQVQVKVLDGAPQLLQLVPILTVSVLVELATLHVHFVGDRCQLLGDYRLYHEKNLAEADRIFKYLNEILVFLSHVFNLSPELLLNADEVAQLALESIHLHVFKFFIFFIQAALNFGHVLQSFLVSFHWRLVYLVTFLSDWLGLNIVFLRLLNR